MPTDTKTITEADVGAFLRSHQSALELPEWARLVAYSDDDSRPFGIYGSHPGCGYKFFSGYGATIAEAVASFRAELPPTGTMLARQKREEAARLLAEAESIEEAAPKEDEL